MLAKREANRFWNKVAARARTVLILSLTVAVILLSYGWYDGRQAVKQLADQRQQFLYCKDLPKGTPGCEEPVVPKRDVEDRPSLQLIRGPKGDKPSEAELMLVFARFCSERADKCRGADGKSVPRSEVLAMVQQQVVAYCADDRCKGPKGDTGATGANGADSTVPGPAGPPGPACPEGFTPQSTQVLTSDGVRNATLCLE